MILVLAPCNVGMLRAHQHRTLIAMPTSIYLAAAGHQVDAEHYCTMRFGSTDKVLAKCKLKHYRISECTADPGGSGTH